MLVSELFEKGNVSCPGWLQDTILDDNWKDAEYSLENNLDTWILKNDYQNLKITFDGIEFHFIGYDHQNNIMFDNIKTEFYEVQS